MFALDADDFFPAVARLRGLQTILLTVPGAYAPVSMLAPAPQADPDSVDSYVFPGHELKRPAHDCSCERASYLFNYEVTGSA